MNAIRISLPKCHLLVNSFDDTSIFWLWYTNCIHLLTWSSLTKMFGGQNMEVLREIRHSYLYVLIDSEWRGPLVMCANRPIFYPFISHFHAMFFAFDTSLGMPQEIVVIYQNRHLDTPRKVVWAFAEPSNEVFFIVQAYMIVITSQMDYYICF